MSDSDKKQESGSNPQREQAQARNEREGEQFKVPEHDNSQFTFGKTADPKYPDGSDFISRTSAEGEKDPTMVVGSKGEILNEAPED